MKTITETTSPKSVSIPPSGRDAAAPHAGVLSFVTLKKPVRFPRAVRAADADHRPVTHQPGARRIEFACVA